MTDKNEEILKKFQENRKKNKGVNGVYERYFDDIITYMKEKFPDEPVERVMEAAGFVTGRAYVFMCDMMVERDKDWKRFHEKEISRLTKKSRNVNLDKCYLYFKYTRREEIIYYRFNESHDVIDIYTNFGWYRGLRSDEGWSYVKVLARLDEDKYIETDAYKHVLCEENDW